MIDELPEGWTTVRLVEMLEPGGLFDGPFGSSLKSSDYTDAGVRVVRLENIANLRFVENKHTYISEAKYRTLLKHNVGAGDVIVGSFVDGAIRVCVLPSLPTKAIAKADCFCVRTRPGLDRRFLMFQLGRSETRDALMEEIHGATRPRITTRQLRDFEIVLAPVAEQRRIVEKVEALLGRVNAARDRLAKVPLILKRVRQSVLAAAFLGRLTEPWRAIHSDVCAPVPPPPLERRRRRRGANLSGETDLLIEQMPEVPDSWRYARLDQLVEPGTVITYGIVLPGPELDGGVPYVRQQDIEDGRIRMDELRHTTHEIADAHVRSALREGDVLLCIIRNLRVAIVPQGIDGANITQGTVRIRPATDLVLAQYLAHYLAGPHAQAWMKQRYFGMDMPRINVEDARAIPVALPPIPEQRQIVGRLETLFALADNVERSVAAATERADGLTQSVLTKAFRGELMPTESELARIEGRAYEDAEALLRRIRNLNPDAGSNPNGKQPRRKRASKRARSASPRASR